MYIPELIQNIYDVSDIDTKLKMSKVFIWLHPRKLESKNFMICNKTRYLDGYVEVNLNFGKRTIMLQKIIGPYDYDIRVIKEDSVIYMKYETLTMLENFLY